MLTGQPDRRFDLDFPGTLNSCTKYRLRNASDRGTAGTRTEAVLLRAGFGYSGNYPNNKWYVSAMDGEAFIRFN